MAGSHYLQSRWPWSLSLLAGTALRAQAAAVLVVNNVRDMEADCTAGRRNLDVWMGDGPARRLMLPPFALLAPLLLNSTSRRGCSSCCRRCCCAWRWAGNSPPCPGGG